MNFLDGLVEQRIAAAAAQGAFNDLPGAGRPLALEEELLTPEDLRLVNRILKNAGLVPPAVEKRQERTRLCRQLPEASPETRHRLMKRILALDMALEAERGQSLCIPQEYSAPLAERLIGSEDR
ncbi:MAG: DUF1992 domain-containing protein [Zoogloeaceae bacterium]|jgi:hypothetical protein|nr:DUF1992 domain-containing protein [Zoogloeaceae bacterium]